MQIDKTMPIRIFFHKILLDLIFFLFLGEAECNKTSPKGIFQSLWVVYTTQIFREKMLEDLPYYFCFRHGTGTGSPSRRGVRHFWRTLRHSRPFLQKCLRAGNLFFQVCRDRLYVFDSGRFSWNLFLNCDSGFAFLF